MGFAHRSLTLPRMNAHRLAARWARPTDRRHGQRADQPPRRSPGEAALLLDLVGRSEHAIQRPGELSGGQLDSETAKQIMYLLHAVVESEAVTALVATHDPTSSAWPTHSKTAKSKPIYPTARGVGPRPRYSMRVAP